MIKQFILCSVVAIAITVAGYCLCQNEAFVMHYCAMLFVCAFSAMICTVAFWSKLHETLDGYSEETKRSIIEDNIAFTIMAWLLPIGVFAIGLIK